jgi:zinc protease
VILNPAVDEKQVLIEIDRVLANLSTVTGKEIERARNTILKDLLFSLQGPLERAERLLSYHRFAGNTGYLEKDIERYKNANEISLKKCVKEYLDDNARKVLVAKPNYMNNAPKE